MMNPENCIYSFQFPCAQELSNTLKHCFGFEFHITNEQYEFLVAFNHHDYLILSGTAIKNIVYGKNIILLHKV